MAAGPTPRAPRRRLFQRSKRPAPERPDPAELRRARLRLLAIGLVVTALATAAVVWLEHRVWRPDRPPREVERIAAGLRAAGLAVDRVARNSHGGWSVLFDEGEVQWFKAHERQQARLHPIREMTEARRDPNAIVIDLHPTVFAIILSGRRQGSTLELGTSPTSAEVIAATVRTAVGAPSTAR